MGYIIYDKTMHFCINLYLKNVILTFPTISLAIWTIALVHWKSKQGQP